MPQTPMIEALLAQLLGHRPGLQRDGGSFYGPLPEEEPYSSPVDMAPPPPPAEALAPPPPPVAQPTDISRLASDVVAPQPVAETQDVLGQGGPSPQEQLLALLAQAGVEPSSQAQRHQALLEELGALAEREKGEGRMAQTQAHLENAGALIGTPIGPGAAPMGPVTRTPPIATAEVDRRALLDKYNLEEQQAAQDPTSERSRQMQEVYRALGIDLPGASYETLDRQGPDILDFAGKQALASTAPRGKPLDNAAVTQVTRYDVSAKELDQFLWMIELPKSQGAVGPIEGRVGRILDAIGMSDTEKAEFRRRIDHFLNLYIKEMTGAQLSREEARRLKRGLAEATWTHDRLLESFKSLRRAIAEDRKIFLDTQRKAGRDVSGFLGEDEDTGYVAQDAKGYLAILDPSGKRVAVHPDDYERLLADPKLGYKRAP